MTKLPLSTVCGANLRISAKTDGNYKGSIIENRPKISDAWLNREADVAVTSAVLHAVINDFRDLHFFRINNHVLMNVIMLSNAITSFEWLLFMLTHSSDIL